MQFLGPLEKDNQNIILLPGLEKIMESHIFTGMQQFREKKNQ